MPGDHGSNAPQLPQELPPSVVAALGLGPHGGSISFDGLKAAFPTTSSGQSPLPEHPAIGHLPGGGVVDPPNPSFADHLHTAVHVDPHPAVHVDPSLQHH